MILAGLLVSSDPKLYFQCTAEIFSKLMFGFFVGCALTEFLAPKLGQRIQTHVTEPKKYAQEIKGSAATIFVLSLIAAWPYQMTRQGKPTAFCDTFEESLIFGSYILFGVKMVFITLAADAWTYFKHRSLHHPSIYAFHKEHHTFYDPSTYAGFSLHPVESLYTFCPIWLFCIPGLQIYAPVHIPFLLSWSALNFYLHCGYYVPVLENIMPYFFINTSAFHNIHHEKTVTHFGEMVRL